MVDLRLADVRHKQWYRRVASRRPHVFAPMQNELEPPEQPKPLSSGYYTGLYHLVSSELLLWHIMIHHGNHSELLSTRHFNDYDILWLIVWLAKVSPCVTTEAAEEKKNKLQVGVDELEWFYDEVPLEEFDIWNKEWGPACGFRSLETHDWFTVQGRDSSHMHTVEKYFSKGFLFKDSFPRVTWRHTKSHLTTGIYGNQRIYIYI